MKKGSLQLGISTIVMLVIAMVLIAGGITFIRGFLGKGTDSLNQAFDITDFTIQPDSSKRLVFAEGNTISIKKGDRVTLKIGIYNGETQPQDFFLVMEPSVDCVSASGNNDDVAPQLTFNKQSLESGESKIFNIFMTAEDENGDALEKDDYLCLLHIKKGSLNGDEYASTDAVIEIFT